MERDNAFSRRIDCYMIVFMTVSSTDRCKLRLHVSRFEFEIKVSPPNLEVNRHMPVVSDGKCCGSVDILLKNGKHRPSDRRKG